MYGNLRNFLIKKRGTVLSRKFRETNSRLYHSDNGVYGYRAKKPRVYDGTWTRNVRALSMIVVAVAREKIILFGFQCPGNIWTRELSTVIFTDW